MHASNYKPQKDATVNQEFDNILFMANRMLKIEIKLEADRTHHADAFLQYTPHTEIVSGDHFSRQGFPGTH